MRSQIGSANVFVTLRMGWIKKGAKGSYSLTTYLNYSLYDQTAKKATKVVST